MENNQRNNRILSITKTSLSLVKNEFKGSEPSSIADIIGRDASEKLKRTPPVFEYKPVRFYNPLIKWCMGVFQYNHR